MSNEETVEYREGVTIERVTRLGDIDENSKIFKVRVFKYEKDGSSIQYNLLDEAGFDNEEDQKKAFLLADVVRIAYQK